MRSLTTLGIEFAGEEGHGGPIWGKKEMSAHRWVSRRVRGWSLESGSRRSFGWSLVDGDAERSAHELAGVSSRRRAAAGEVQAREGEAERSGRVHSLGASPWRSCTRRGLTGGARNGVRAPNGDGALPPVGHVGEVSLIQTAHRPTDRATSPVIISQTRAN